jgi:hypothetical protein
MPGTNLSGKNSTRKTAATDAALTLTHRVPPSSRMTQASQRPYSRLSQAARAKGSGTPTSSASHSGQATSSHSSAVAPRAMAPTAVDQPATARVESAVGRCISLRGSTPNQRCSTMPWISSRKGPATAS